MRLDFGDGPRPVPPSPLGGTSPGDSGLDDDPYPADEDDDPDHGTDNPADHGTADPLALDWSGDPGADLGPDPLVAAIMFAVLVAACVFWKA